METVGFAGAVANFEFFCPPAQVATPRIERKTEGGILTEAPGKANPGEIYRTHTFRPTPDPTVFSIFLFSSIVCIHSSPMLLRRPLLNSADSIEHNREHFATPSF